MTLRASTILLAAEEQREGIDLILPETGELLWGLIAFILVLIILNKVAFPALRQTIEARERKIQSDLESAENARHEAQRQLDDYKRQLAEARGEANRIIEEARQAAEQVRKDTIDRANKEAEAIIQRAGEQLSAERNRALQELQSTIAGLSLDLAEKVVGRTLDRESQRDFVDAYIREVSAMSGDGNGRRA